MVVVYSTTSNAYFRELLELRRRHAYRRHVLSEAFRARASHVSPGCAASTHVGFVRFPIALSPRRRYSSPLVIDKCQARPP